MNPNYNSHLFQQQHLQQHQHQSQQQGSQQAQLQRGPSLQQDQTMNQNNMDPSRLQQWSQLRYGQNVAPDMNHVKPVQFAEMIKRNQVANQFGRHQSQQSFATAAAMGLGIQQPQNGANIFTSNQQQQPFHEQHPSNMSQQLSQPFPNMGVMSNANANAAASASLQGRNIPGLLPTSQPARQHEMVGIQQPQGTSANKFQSQPQLASLRESQQIQFSQGLNQNSPADMFPDVMRRSSPHPGNGVQQTPVGVQVPQQGFIGHMPGTNRQNLELQQRMQVMGASLRTSEAQLAAVQSQAVSFRGNPTTEAQYSARIDEIRTDIAKRKEQMTRLMMLWKQQQSSGAGISLGNAGQPANNHWASPGQPFDPMGQTRQPSMGLIPNQPTHPMQTSPNLSHVSTQSNPLLNSGLQPPRNIPTPHQSSQSISPYPNPANGMGMSFTPSLLPKGSASLGGNPIASINQPTPLTAMDKAQFEANFKAFLTKRTGNHDRLRYPDNRQLDLHSLYLQVKQEGGFPKIEGNDNLWSIIAARLGYVQFPGSATEPAKSGPGVAQSLQHLFKEFIAPFDAWYSHMVQEFKKQSNAALTAAFNGRYNLQQLLQMVNRTPAELQSKGVDEQTIQLLEAQRIPLQRLLQEQRNFSDGVRINAQNAGHGDQNGVMTHRPPAMGPSTSFGAGSSQSQNNLSMTGRQSLQPHMMPQQGGQHLQPTIPNGVDGLIGTRIPGPNPSNLTPQAQMGGNFLQGFAPKLSPGQNQATQAAHLIDQFRTEYATSTYATANLDVPIEQQVEYTQFLEQLHPQCVEMERRLGPMAMILKDVHENLLQRLITILCAVNHQWSNLSASVPRYIVNLEQLKVMGSDLARINEICVASFQNFRMQIQNKQLGVRPQLQPQMVNNSVVAKPEMSSQSTRPVMPHSRPPSEVPPQQQPQQAQLSQPSPSPSNSNQTLRPLPTMSLQPPQKRKPPQTPGGTVAASSPSPAAVPTPYASTPTPSATTSSPKPKASTKTKAANSKQRRPSKVILPVTVTPTPEEAKRTPPTKTVTPGKRPREEESTLAHTPGESPEMNESPPKRVKTEWETPPSEIQRKQSEAISNIKSEEEATAVFDQMTELIKRAAEGEGFQPSSITSGISETLDMLLKGYGPVPDAVDGFSLVTGGESSSSRESDAVQTLGDPFDEFFDFSFGTVEDEDSRTPELVSSSSANPSPASTYDADSGHPLLSSASSSTIDAKLEDLSDPLRLASWKEIDGGESAYFQSTEFKYDGPMTSMDQPWAIFNS